jgi:hypothetical protein
MNKFEADKILGNKTEENIVQVIENYFKTKITKTEELHPMDFYDDKAYYEVKSRRNNHNKYPTTMIGYNKINFVKNSNKDAYFIFSFTDGNYYYKYDINDRFKIKIGGRQDRGIDEYKKYLFIPIEKLIKI